MYMEGYIIGFNEYISLVLDDAEEIHSKTKSRKQLGKNSWPFGLREIFIRLQN